MSVFPVDMLPVGPAPTYGELVNECARIREALLDSQKHEIAANLLVMQRNEEVERLKRRLKNINDLSMTALHLDRPISVEARELLQRIVKESR